MILMNIIKIIKDHFCPHEFEKIYVENNNVIVFKCKKCGKIVKSYPYVTEVWNIRREL